MTAGVLGMSLGSALEAVDRDAVGQAVGCAVLAIAEVAIKLADLIAMGNLAGALGASTEVQNGGGDTQKYLDIAAHDLFLEALTNTPVAVLLSEEADQPKLLNAGAPLAVALDPLDGSANIDANMSIGTIFSILPSLPVVVEPGDHFLQPGHNQLAAGFVVYGPQTSIVLAIDGCTRIFTLDRTTRHFRLSVPCVTLPERSAEYAINASNYRHWDAPVRAFIDDCVKGAEGPLHVDHNMRWIASLVAECYRILTRGGLFLYPTDRRRGYRRGRLRLIYEANPIAFVVELAGGGATDTVRRILDLTPTDLHGRVGLVFGSLDEVRLVARYHTDPEATERAPLFARRGLLRH